MDAGEAIRNTLKVALRECGIIKRNPMYLFCMVIMPIIVMLFFTSLMSEGQPTDMPVGVVDLDNTATTRSMIRKLDAFQTTKVAKYYSNPSEARNAMQRNEIYAFIYFPKGTTSELLSMRQPKISFYYSSTSLTAGALLFRDLKTISTLGSAGVGMSVLSAKGLTSEQIMSYLQPIVTDLHTVNNPAVNYSVYLCTMLIPGSLMLFIILLTPYSIGTELKFGTSKKWLSKANGNIFIAIVGKMLPQTLTFLLIIYAYMVYVFGVLDFPHQGGVGTMLLLGALVVLACQGFGVFMFGLVPSLRMSISMCCLWAVLSFSLVGTAFPLSAMDTPIQSIAQLFPLRHYYMIYQLNIFNGYPLGYTWLNLAALVAFAALPLLTMHNIKRAMLQDSYLP